MRGLERLEQVRQEFGHHAAAVVRHLYHNIFA